VRQSDHPTAVDDAKQPNPAQSLVASLFASPSNGARHDKAKLAICEKAAEQGLPTVQITLAQFYAARRSGPQDLVHAYMWFLIAGEQISQAKNHVNQSMTMEQLLEAEQRAAEWIRKMRRSHRPRRSKILPTHRPPDPEKASRTTVS
jgi:TPR repeat protein